jgi:hypothetical protein
MCYNTQTSFTTFLFVLLISILLWKKGKPIHKTLAVILLFISLMQIVEGLLWINIKCTNVNQTISTFIPILLFLQPLIAIGTIYYFNTGLLPPIFYKILIGIWLLSSPLFFNWMQDGIGKCTSVSTKGYLQWPFANSSTYPHQIIQSIYNFILLTAFITLNTEWFGLFYVFIAAASYFITRNLYGNSWGSLWCHFVNILAAASLFVK